MEDDGLGTLFTRTRYAIPLVRLQGPNSPTVRRKLREMARPLRDGIVPFYGGFAAWPHGSLCFLSNGLETIAWPSAFGLGVLYWEVDQELRRPILPVQVTNMSMDVV